MLTGLAPRSDWTPPVGPLPHLANTDVAIDTEVHDEGLANEQGPGWATGRGKLVGVSVAWAGGAIYVPVRHPETENRPMEEVAEWIEGLLRRCRCHFFNMPYDMGWLSASGVDVWPERAEDGQAMAVMIDENWDSYSLDSCCARAGLPGKDESLLEKAAEAYGIPRKHGSVKHGLWRLPARYVGPYAEQDAVATLRLCKALWPTIETERLEEAYRTEIDLMQVTHHMRRRGIRVSREAAKLAQERVRAEVKNTLAQIDAPPGWHRSTVTIDDLRSPAKLADIFDAEGVQYPRTAKTQQPSFTKEWLAVQTTPVAALVRRARQLEDVAEKFIGNYIIDHIHVGKIHAEIHQLRGETGGAKTMRLSYSNPPLQQMPSRDPELAPIVRGMFFPEEGELWGAPDYSQQEPRLYVHYAHLCVQAAKKLNIRMNGTEEAIAYYRDKGNDADFHQMMADVTGLPRRTAKDINLGVFYRMGADKFSAQTRIPLEQAEALFEQYHANAPWIRGLAQYAEARAHTMGYIRMIDGARRHYPLWQPRKDREAGGFARRADAEARWPGRPLERAFAYQAGNSLIQGSAARQTKMAMVACFRAGHTPLVQMHDELDFSFGSLKQALEVEEIMRTIVNLVVPIKVDLEFGTSWGNAKNKDWEATRRMAA